MNSRCYRIAYITAGAAGMYCGSCMHDNTLARAMTRLGHDVQLIPLYTPIRTDEEDVSVDRVFFGGISVYLLERAPLLRWMPDFALRLLDSPRLLAWATSRGMETNAKHLGALTVSMLRGSHGHQRREAKRLCDWLAESVRPQVINLSNALIAGCTPQIKEHLRVPVVVTLQGDDIFLDQLVEPYRSQALAELGRLVPFIDAFVVNSRYYADYMGEYLGIPAEKFRVAPLGLDTADFEPYLNDGKPAAPSGRPPTIGYLARVAPEKGLHLLAEAFIALRQAPGMHDARLRIAGWLGAQHREYAEQAFQKLRDAGLGDAFEYVGEVDRAGKLEFLKSIDVLSVPTVYREPKGLFVLEALAAGVPVVQPDHGAFPELLEALGGGVLFPPGDSAALARSLHAVLSDGEHRRRLSELGRGNVHRHRNSESMAQAVLEALTEFLEAEQSQAAAGSASR